MPGLVNGIVLALGNRLAWLFVLTVLATIYEVVARYLFNSPTIWAHETTVMLCSVAFAIGGAYVQASDEHIRVTVITERLGEPMRRLVELVGRLMGIVFLAGILWGGYRDAWEALSGWQTTQTAFNSPMPAIVKPVVLLASLLMILLVVRDIVRSFGSSGK